MPAVAELRGLWQRSLIALPDGSRDTTTDVRWLQGLRAYADLRRPSPIPDYSHARALADLTQDDCLRLAEQQGFAGYFSFDGRYFAWARAIDFQPKGPHADVGSLHWEDGVLIERGRDLNYVEHWHRSADVATEPAAGAALRDSLTGAQAMLVRVGGYFMFARDRFTSMAPLRSLPTSTSLPPWPTLRDCVAAASSLRECQALVDCEISFGTATALAFHITASTLPFRIGDMLNLDQRWTLVETEGDLAALAPSGIHSLQSE